MSTISFFVDFSFDSNDSFSERYEFFYKKLVSFLFKNQEISMVFHFDGESIEWFEKNHAEFFQILHKLLDRKQIEIIGGGFYNPIFPLIFPMDRTGQIEKLTAILRQITGKRPRGFFLFDSCWSESLIPSLNNCGFEYVLLQSNMIPQKYRSKGPLISNHLGKSISIVETTTVPVVEGTSLENAIRALSSSSAAQSYHIVQLDFSFFDFEAVFSFLKNNGGGCDFSFSLPSDYVKTCRHFTKAHVPEYTRSDFITNSPMSSALFNRMMYVSLLLNQLKGDKARKNLAREQLWFSQNGKFYTSENHELFQKSYKNLLSAERCIREFTDFRESITAFDYDNDGFTDYLCLMEQFGACISPLGAKIFELNAFKKFGNFCAGGGIFSNLILTDEEFSEYKAAKQIRTIFSDCLFSEMKFDGLKKDITLVSEGEFSPLNLLVSLKKKYVANSNGFMVQMIVKNESPIELRGTLVVESNFAQMAFGKNQKSYNLEAISNDKKEIINEIEDGAPRALENISYLKLTDASSETAFVFEPNENCDVIASKAAQNGGETTRASLCWKLSLSPGIEIEKTINFSIVSMKNRK
ncbi:MAG: DUF1926 domain-containing protein [Treponema sp.]|nr:DUF1926 domain-containing protein [Treponema sp.]